MSGWCRLCGGTDPGLRPVGPDEPIAAQVHLAMGLQINPHIDDGMSKGVCAFCRIIFGEISSVILKYRGRQRQLVHKYGRGRRKPPAQAKIVLYRCSFCAGSFESAARLNEHASEHRALLELARSLTAPCRVRLAPLPCKDTAPKTPGWVHLDEERIIKIDPSVRHGHLTMRPPRPIEVPDSDEEPPSEKSPIELSDDDDDRPAPIRKSGALRIVSDDEDSPPKRSSIEKSTSHRIHSDDEVNSPLKKTAIRTLASSRIISDDDSPPLKRVFIGKTATSQIIPDEDNTLSKKIDIGKSTSSRATPDDDDSPSKRTSIGEPASSRISSNVDNPPPKRATIGQPATFRISSNDDNPPPKRAAIGQSATLRISSDEDDPPPKRAAIEITNNGPEKPNKDTAEESSDDLDDCLLIEPNESIDPDKEPDKNVAPAPTANKSYPKPIPIVSLLDHPAYSSNKNSAEKPSQFSIGSTDILSFINNFYMKPINIKPTGNLSLDTFLGVLAKKPIDVNWTPTSKSQTARPQLLSMLCSVPENPMNGFRKLVPPSANSSVPEKIPTIVHIESLQETHKTHQKSKTQTSIQNSAQSIDFESVLEAKRIPNRSKTSQPDPTALNNIGSISKKSNVSKSKQPVTSSSTDQRKSQNNSGCKIQQPNNRVAMPLPNYSENGNLSLNGTLQSTSNHVNNGPSLLRSNNLVPVASSNYCQSDNLLNGIQELTPMQSLSNAAMRNLIKSMKVPYNNSTMPNNSRTMAQPHHSETVSSSKNLRRILPKYPTQQSSPNYPSNMPISSFNSSVTSTSNYHSNVPISSFNSSVTSTSTSNYHSNVPISSFNSSVTSTSTSNHSVVQSSNNSNMMATSNYSLVPSSNNSSAMEMSNYSIVPSSNNSSVIATSNYCIVQPPNNSNMMATSNYSNVQTSNSSHMKPASNSLHMKPASNGSHMNPASNNSHMNPASNSSHMNPASNSSHMKPASNSSHMNPASNSSHMNPASNSSHMNPASNSSHMNPASNSSHMNPASNSSHMKPASNNSIIHTSNDSRVMPGNSRTMPLPSTSTGQNKRPVIKCKPTEMLLDNNNKSSLLKSTTDQQNTVHSIPYTIPMHTNETDPISSQMIPHQQENLSAPTHHQPSVAEPTSFQVPVIINHMLSPAYTISLNQPSTAQGLQDDNIPLFSKFQHQLFTEMNIQLIYITSVHEAPLKTLINFRLAVNEHVNGCYVRTLYFVYLHVDAKMNIVLEIKNLAKAVEPFPQWKYVLQKQVIVSFTNSDFINALRSCVHHNGEYRNLIEKFIHGANNFNR